MSKRGRPKKVQQDQFNDLETITEQVTENTVIHAIGKPEPRLDYSKMPGKNVRTKIINALIQHLDAKSYLEIGTQDKNENFNQIKCNHKFCVDVDPKSKPDFVGTSDSFFERQERFDVIFIDGDHSYNQAKKDILNAIKLANKAVVCHDTNPLNKEYTKPEWSGEVYKVISELGHDIKTYLDDKHGLTIIYPSSEKFDSERVPCETFEQFEANKAKILNIV